MWRAASNPTIYRLKAPKTSGNLSISTICSFEIYDPTFELGLVLDLMLQLLVLFDQLIQFILCLSECTLRRGDFWLWLRRRLEVGNDVRVGS
jgi:hypothetical protein